MRILFVMESLGKGGAERVLVNLVNAMDKAHEITVCTLFEKGINAERLAPHIRLVNRGAKRFKGIKFLSKFLPKKWLYRHYVQKAVKGEFDLTVAYMTGVPTTVVAGAPTPKIAWLHGDFTRKKGDCKGLLRDLGLRAVYQKYNAVVGCSRVVTDSFVQGIGIDPARTCTLYNTNDTAYIRRMAKEPCPIEKKQGVPTMVTVGCLEPVKGFERLILACAQLKRRGHVFALWILGEGYLKERLQAVIEENDLADEIQLLGYQTNPFAFERAAELFVCSSYSEGLSTAVSEAVILGLPVLSTDVSGAKEILGEESEYGMVCENTDDALLCGLETLLTDPDLRAHYREQATARAPFFETAQTVSAVEDLFTEILTRERNN